MRLPRVTSFAALLPMLERVSGAENPNPYRTRD